MKNILTIDFESLGFANFVEKPEVGFEKHHLEKPLDKILMLLQSFNYSATFFFVGKVAEAYPELVRSVHSAGHQIGSHSYRHQLVYNQSAVDFEKDLQKSLEVLRQISTQPVDCYRAPSWSYKSEINNWFWNILKDNGIIYDSSVFPVKNFLYGEPNAPRFIHKKNNGIIEIPPSTFIFFNNNYGFSGGLYLRLLPVQFIKKQIKKINAEGNPAVVYIHPWELDYKIPKIKNLKMNEKFITYHNIKNTYKKLHYLFDNFEFCSISEYLSEEQMNA